MKCQQNLVGRLWPSRRLMWVNAVSLRVVAESGDTLLERLEPRSLRFPLRAGRSRERAPCFATTLPKLLAQVREPCRRSLPRAPDTGS